MGRRSRGGDPPTSDEGGEDTKNKRRDMAKVWELFIKLYPRPLMDWQIEDYLGPSIDRDFSKRRSDLKTEGFLVAAGGKDLNPHSRKPQLYWKIHPDIAARLDAAKKNEEDEDDNT